MANTSRTDDVNAKTLPPGFITKETPHILSVLLIGLIVGVEWSGDRIILHYQDGHKAYIEPTEGELQVGDWEVPSC